MRDRRIVTYGFSAQADVRGGQRHADPGRQPLRGDHPPARRRDAARSSTIDLPMPGRHNVQNALAAIAVALELGIADAAIRDGFARFGGVKRRFTRVGEVDGAVTIIDDYGHHPVEIRAVLSAAREGVEGRVIAVVQPHRFTRLRDLMDEFQSAFNDADMVYVAPVYAAGEAPIDGVDADALVAGLKRARPSLGAARSRGRSSSPAQLAAVVEPGDMVVCLGAGDITKWAAGLADAIAARTRRDRPHDRWPPSASTMRRAAAVARTGGGACLARRLHLVPDRRRRRMAGAPGRSSPISPPSSPRSPADVPVMAVGLGSNLIVRDGGVPGVVVRLRKAFAQVAVEPATASAPARRRWASPSPAPRAMPGIAGLEFLRGIPGTVGGAVRMNAGAYGREVADILVEATVVLRDGTVETLAGGEARLCLSPFRAARRRDRRRGAVRRATPGDPAAIGAEMDRIAAEREASQPLRSATGGSTFKNPPGHKAWAADRRRRLPRAAGCGDAQVSEKHCNFLLNLGGATSAEIEALGEEVRASVATHSRHRRCAGKSSGSGRPS